MYIEPMLLATAPAPFSDSRFIFEPKIDGHRLIFSQQNDVVRLYTRHYNDCTRQYPEIASALFPHDIVLDGEIACVDSTTGNSDFETIMTRFQAKKDLRIKQLVVSSPVTYVVFDILQYKGRDLRKLLLIERKEILQSIKMPNQQFGVIPYVEGVGEALFEQMQIRKLEGMVGKRKNSLYVSRRSPAWQKVINWSYTDVIITGYRKDEFGLLAAVQNESGGLRPAGIVEYVTKPTKKEFYLKSRSLVTGEDKNFVYLSPTTRGRVKFRNWYKSGMLRTPVLTELLK